MIERVINMEPVKLVIIGASFAGISSALTAKSLNKDADVTLIDRQETVGYIPNNINQLLKGKIDTLKKHPSITKEQLLNLGISLMLGQEVVDIDVDNKIIKVTRAEKESTIYYDKLILAMGSNQTSERIEGTDHPAVLTSKTHVASLKTQAELERAEHILIIGGGYVGLEAADAYVTAQKQVTIIETFDSLAFKTYDPEMIAELEKRILKKGVRIDKNQQVKAVQETVDGLITITSQNKRYHSDHVLLALNFRPNNQLVVNQLDCHLDRTITINEFLQTSDPDIYAVGDLIRVPYIGTANHYYLPLVNHAVITGRIAAMNALGFKEPMEPLVRVVGSHLFGLYCASVGLTEREAQLYHETLAVTHHEENDDGVSITLKLIVEKESGKILGGQVYSESNIFSLMDTMAVAIKANMRDRDLALQDFLYYSAESLIRPVLQETAFLAYQKRLKGGS